ncbi:V-type ATP synthase subunit K [Aedoeadaptatus ivorii]|uniref:V-type ATP synthase subunit K n=1 Tax=Aedoeadaptatus ivorii TaxID=54006 RepID=A0A448UZF7_9FIRM|nr:ATP synthase subunit C [Peptoniphilus ivorii]MDQ0508519.1 V/A-type H+-transporting ATPase subunit K [Peptoniphilus ivorii]VEJ34332.1 V-type ATP synthase subunit K [Peptoniphilus ivorii]
MEKILFFASLIVISTIVAGFIYLERGVSADRAKLKSAMRTNLAVFIPTVVAAYVLLVPGVVEAATAPAEVNGLGLLAAALSTGLATIGTGYAVGVVGSAALGAVSEDDSILGKTLIFVGLAEGIAIYGLIISIMILGKL